MTDWGFLRELFASLQAHSPMLGRLWLLLMLVFRMLILGTMASDMFNDEQEEFSCNTLQPGCKQVCYDQAFPISQYRFWVFHIVLISTPALVFLMYAMHHYKKQQVPAKDSTIRILQADRDLHLKRLYLVNVVFRMLSEVAFLIGQWKLYGFRVQALFPCSHFPCPHTVDCFTSRPMEKTVFLLFYFAIGILSVVSSLAEFIHIIFKWFTKSSGRLQSLVLEDTEIQEESRKTRLSPAKRKNKAGVEKPGRSKKVRRLPVRTGRTRPNAGTRKSSIGRKNRGEHHRQKDAELRVVNVTMSSTPLAETEEDVFDLTDAVPETERLDSSLQKAKAQLSIKTRRHRPSRSRLRDSLSSTEGDDSFDGKSYTGLLSGSCSPLHVSLRCPSPFSDLHPSSCPAKKDRAFSFEAAEKEQKRRSACFLTPSSPTYMLKQDRQEDHVHLHHRDHVQQRREDSPHLELHHKENALLHLRDNPQLNQEDRTHLRQRDHAHPVQADHNQVHQGDHQSDQTHLRQGDRTHLHKRDQLLEGHTHLHKRDQLQKNQSHLGEEDQVQLSKESPSPLRQREYSQSEDDGHDIGSDEPSSPTVLLDKKTRRRFLDLGVTLRRTYGKVRRERASRHAAENREPDGAQSRSSRSSGPPFVPFSWLTDRIRGSGSPKNSSQSPAKCLSEEDEELKNDGRSTRNESSQPYQSLSDHSDEGRDGYAEGRVVKKKTILPFSSGGRDKTEKQNGVQRDKRDSGHDGDDQKLLTSQSQCKNLDI